ncbi:hypothetical protein HMPREF0645_2011 [Hallella bergensis DSM 17361]|uniref:Uncharacterized protein n=1 Tax=Hallella bergensis DSM 17361 TaxID=585502 RepID=D1PYH6_9BACT|nr:hypothetical protein HMPREF0645_2011 [Hallella bergensis DSM 17361]
MQILEKKITFAKNNSREFYELADMQGRIMVDACFPNPLNYR